MHIAIINVLQFRKKIKEQIRDLKREMKNPSEDQEQELSKKQKLDDVNVNDEEDNEILKDFHELQKKYAVVKTTRRGKGNSIAIVH